MKSIPAVCVFMCLVFAPSVMDAQEMLRISGESLTVQYTAPLDNAAREVLRLYPSVLSELEELFDTSVTFAPTIVLIHDRDDFRKIAGQLPVVALALSESDRIIIDNSRMKTYPFTLRVTLKHELCHLFLHHLASGDLPRWFNEGVAQWSSDGIAELIVGNNRNLLNQAVLSKQVIPLSLLEKSFPEDERSLVLAYEQSRSIVGFLSAEYGPDAVVRTLKALQTECDIDCALLKGAGMTLRKLDERWQASLKKSDTWIVYISSHLYQVLFLFGALILTAGFIRMIVRKRRYKDEEEDIGPDSDFPE